MSWALLFASFFFAIQYLMLDQIDPVFYGILTVLCGLVSTVFSPREPVYDLVRYFMLAILTWIAYHVSIKVMIGIIVFAVVLLPFVVMDFRSERRKNTETSRFVVVVFRFFAVVLSLFAAVVSGLIEGLLKKERKDSILDRWEKKRKAKKAAERAWDEELRRRCEWLAGWGWD